MKKLLSTLAVTILLCTSHHLMAQAGFQLGLKGGLNFSNVQTDLSTDGSTGFHAGAFAMIKISKIGIQPELIYSTQDADITVNSVRQELTSGYVNVPVMIKFYLIQGLNLQLGPQFGFNTFSELKDTATGDTEDIQDQLKSSDVSLAFGAGVDLPFGLNLTARYNLGLSDFNDTLDLDAATDDQLKNQVFQVSVGYALLKK